VEWKSQNLVGYYYGVRPDEAFPGREIYEGGAGSNSFVRLAGRYNLARHWTLVGMVEREFLSSTIKASPIVTGSAVDTFFTGLFYQF
jgi:outer membrane protein